jgi:hypothetical protein
MTEALSEIVCIKDFLDAKEARHRLDQEARTTATRTELHRQPSYPDQATRIRLCRPSYANQATRTTRLRGPSYTDQATRTKPIHILSLTGSNPEDDPRPETGHKSEGWTKQEVHNTLDHAVECRTEVEEKCDDATPNYITDTKKEPVAAELAEEPITVELEGTSHSRAWKNLPQQSREEPVTAELGGTCHSTRTIRSG